MIMLDPHRTFAAGTDLRAPHAEPRAEPRLAPCDALAAEARMLLALRARVRRVALERAPDSLGDRVRAMLDRRA